MNLTNPYPGEICLGQPDFESYLICLDQYSDWWAIAYHDITLGSVSRFLRVNSEIGPQIITKNNKLIFEIGKGLRFVR